jgi:hypothetical protein
MLPKRSIESRSAGAFIGQTAGAATAAADAIIRAALL